MARGKFRKYSYSKNPKDYLDLLEYPYSSGRGKSTIKSWEVQNPDFEINLLTPENILDFLPAFKKENLQLSPANFSDLVRLQLLKKYGGFWLDATIIINDSLNHYIKLIEHEDLNLLAFSSKDHPNHKDYP